MYNDMNTLALKGYYADADFDYATAPLHYYDNEGREVSADSKLIYYRTDTGQPLGIQTSKYNPISHKEMIDTSRDVLDKSGLNLSNLDEEIQTSNNGSMCFVKHTLPEHKITTPDGDSACMSMLHINSFNGVWAYQGSSGARQAACLNSQVFTKGAGAVYKSKHSSLLDVAHGARVILNVLTTMDDQNVMWHTWANTPVTREIVFTTLVEASGSAYAMGKIKEGLSFTEIIDLPRVRNNKSLEYMLARFRSHYSKIMGNNYWALYNTLTDWSTHHTPKTKKNSVSMPVLQLNRSLLVGNLLEAFPA